MFFNVLSLKTLGTSIAGALLPKVIESATNWASETYDSVFESDEDVKPASKPKQYDTKKFTVDNAIFIRWYHCNHEGTQQEHVAFLNRELGFNKSRSSYSRIWAKDFDIDTLSKEENS
jgi:hypothetical protein|tara:strand:+ start:14154 stop:14507 length:354 start_codon:yes stop_codon:yes gene_type:complete